MQIEGNTPAVRPSRPTEGTSSEKAAPNPASIQQDPTGPTNSQVRMDVEKHTTRFSVKLSRDDLSDPEAKKDAAMLRRAFNRLKEIDKSLQLIPWRDTFKFHPIKSEEDFSNIAMANPYPFFNKSNPTSFRPKETETSLGTTDRLKCYGVLCQKPLTHIYIKDIHAF